MNEPWRPACTYAYLGGTTIGHVITVITYFICLYGVLEVVCAGKFIAQASAVYCFTLFLNIPSDVQ